MTYRRDDELPKLEGWDPTTADSITMGIQATRALQDLLRALDANGVLTEEQSTKIWSRFEGNTEP